jgi:hypothetical protein
MRFGSGLKCLVPWVEIRFLCLSSVSPRVTVSRVSPTTWAISSCVKLKLKRMPCSVRCPLTADSSKKQASFSAAEVVKLVFNILISNTDDHLRNHGFLYEGQAGWRLSPACDLNPASGEVSCGFHRFCRKVVADKSKSRPKMAIKQKSAEGDRCRSWRYSVTSRQ